VEKKVALPNSGSNKRRGAGQASPGRKGGKGKKEGLAQRTNFIRSTKM